jgi:hypothetical protein
MFKHPSLNYLGHSATFYIPVAKFEGIKCKMHDFFLQNYNGYTVEKAQIEGFWRSSPDSPVLKDENYKIIVSFEGRERISEFVEFLSDICTEINEECLWLSMGKKSYLVMPLVEVKVYEGR